MSKAPFSDNPIENLKAEYIFKPLDSADELREWMELYFDIRFPKGVIYEGSTHGPIDAMWRIYELFKTGQTQTVPQVVMVASRDSYKCQVKGTKLLSKNGLVNIQDIRVGDTVWSGRNWRKVTDWIDDGKKKSVRFELKNGLELSGTPIHRYWCLRDGISQWIRSEDILPTDLFCVNTSTGIEAQNLLTNQDDYDLGYFLGLLVGDGSLTQMNSGVVSFTNSEKAVIDKYTSLCERFLGIKPECKNQKERFYKTDGIFRKPKCEEVIFYSTEKVKILKDYGLEAKPSHEKTIPHQCYKSNSTMIGFIAGLFDSDGTYNSKNQLDIPITALEVVKDLQKVLISYGIDARIYKNKKLYTYEDKGGCKQNHIVHKLYITGNEYHNKFKKIPLTLLAKKAGEIPVPKIYDAHDTVPLNNVIDFITLCSQQTKAVKGRSVKKPKICSPTRGVSASYKGVTKGKLNDLYLWFLESCDLGLFNKHDHLNMIDSIKEILDNSWHPYVKKEISEDYFYDLTVEEDHSYWSNGVISHNTLSAAAIEVLLFLHFKIPMAHAAAIKFQAGAAVKYANNFFRKVGPYLEYHGWTKSSDNKNTIEWLTSDGDEISLQVLTATKAGFNSAHVPLLCLDELDLMDPDAFAESRMVPSSYKGIAPLILILSTRKFAAGLMESQINLTPKIGGEVFRWNIIDVAENIPPEVAKVDLPKVPRYITAKSLPMQNISEEQWALLEEKEQAKYERFEAYAGISEHPMLSVMKNLLVDRPTEDRGFLYKKLSAVYNNFKVTDIDTASAQLLCEKPTSSGLVYSRFEQGLNTVSPNELYRRMFGEEAPQTLTIENLRDLLVDADMKFYGGADWGFTDFTSLVVLMVTPTGDVYLVDSFLDNHLELDDIVKHAKELNSNWGIDKWFVEQAQPSYLKTLRRNGLRVPDFKKVVADGITALQMKICDSNAKRRFFIVDTPKNQSIIESFGQYRWKTDRAGNIIDGEPYHGSDNGGISDIQDSIRYPMQNLFGNPKKKPQMVLSSKSTQSAPSATDYGKQIMQHVKETTGADINTEVPTEGKKKGVVWSF